MPHRDLAAACVRARDFAGAAVHLRAALAKSPAEPELLFRLGLALIKANRAFDAVEALEAAAAIAPRHPGLDEALAAAYRRDARYADAIRAADAALAAGKGGVQALYERAVSHAALGDGAALADFDRLLALDPLRAAAWVGSHAPALEAAGLAEALRRLDRAVSCPGANGKYWALPCAYALIYGRMEEAERLYAAHIAAHPARHALVDGVRALLDRLAPGCRVFGLSASLLRHALDRAENEGLVLEFGVRRGTSLTHLAHHAGQTVHGFDSFEGLPEGWHDNEAGVLTTGRRLPPVPANARLHPGWFKDTLPAFLAAHPGPVRLVNIDSDIYSSARTVLTLLAPRLRPGSVLVFDEFIGNRSWRDDEYRAFQEFAAETGADWQVIALAPHTKQVAIRLLSLR